MADIIATLGCKDTEERERLGRLVVIIEKDILLSSVSLQIHADTKKTDSRGFVYKRLAVVLHDMRSKLAAEKQDLLRALER